MIWKFSDGTTVELGGKVAGDKLFAQWLRLELSQRKTTSIWPAPSESIPFDSNDPALLDDMLSYLGRLKGVRIAERPDGIPPLPPPPWASDESGDQRIIH